MDKKFADLFTLINTKAELSELEDKINNLLTLLYQEGNLEKKMDEVVTPDQKTAILKICHKEEVDITNPEALKGLLEEILSEIQKIPVLTLQVAIELNNTSVNNISNWILINTKSKYLIDIVIDKKIMGGAIVMLNGVYKDYSLKKAFEEKYEEKSQVARN